MAAAQFHHSPGVAISGGKTAMTIFPSPNSMRGYLILHCVYGVITWEYLNVMFVLGLSLFFILIKY